MNYNETNLAFQQLQKYKSRKLKPFFKSLKKLREKKRFCIVSEL